MWFVPALVDATVPLPEHTPIPCLICKGEATAMLSFSGAVKLAQPDRLEVFDLKTHETRRFTVPADFRGVESSDGVISGAPMTRAKPGLLAQVTYRAAGGHNQATRVLLLTINQCRALMAAERLNDRPPKCPD
jgi:hypothetical protein